MEDRLDAELTEELGYGKYNYKNKETENSRNGHSLQKAAHQLWGGGRLHPRDRKGRSSRDCRRKTKTASTRIIEEKILSMCAKGINAREHISEYMPWKSQSR